MRKLGIDFGDVRIGLALSDPMGIIASPLEVYKHVHYKKDVAYIAELIKKHEVDEVVFGLPLNMDGSSGKRVELTKEFAKSLKEAADVNIIFIDERLTSVASEKLLAAAGKNREKRKESIDMVCAAMILQAYLDKKK